MTTTSLPRVLARVDGRPARVQGLEGVGATLMAIRGDVRADEHARFRRGVERLIALREAFFLRGVTELDYLDLDILRPDAGDLVNYVRDLVDIEVAGEVFPASFLIQRPLRGAKREVAWCEVALALVRVLADGPYSTDGVVSLKLGTRFPDMLDVAAVRAMRRELGIPDPPARLSRVHTLTEAIKRLTPLRPMREHLAQDVLGDRPEPEAPWPAWWHLASVQNAQPLPEGAVWACVRGTLIAMPAAAVEAAKREWARFEALIEGVDEGWLLTAYGELVHRRIDVSDGAHARMLLAERALRKQWPEVVTSTDARITATDVASMLRACDEEDWPLVCAEAARKGLADREVADATDVLVEVLAEQIVRKATSGRE